MAKIHVLNGADVGRSFDVAAGAILGRDAGCDIPLRDPSVSRKHARLELEGGRWRVVDTESRNGLYARGERVRELLLDDSTEFRLGDVELRFRTEASAVAVAPKAPAPADEHGEPDEIVLEGDWSAPPSSPTASGAPPQRPAVAAPRPSAVPPAARAAPSSAPGGPSVAGGSAAPARAGTFGSAAGTASAQPARTAPPLAATAARARPGPSVVAAGRGVLQFNKVENRPGLFNADLSQMPAWMKLAIGVLALLVFAALFWISFRGASFLKGKTQATPDTVESGSEEAR